MRPLRKKDIGIPCRIAGIGNETWFAKMAGAEKHPAALFIQVQDSAKTNLPY